MVSPGEESRLGLEDCEFLNVMTFEIVWQSTEEGISLQQQAEFRLANCFDVVKC